MGMREKLIELLEKAEELADKRCDFAENCDQCPANNQSINCLDWLKADCLIANGVTIPVRCKECKHHEDIYGELFCGSDVRGMVGQVKPDDFCSYGERRTDENDR